jgi:hypothetical protein
MAALRGLRPLPQRGSVAAHQNFDHVVERPAALGLHGCGGVAPPASPGPSSGDSRPPQDASIAMFGNTNQPIDVLVQTGHLFTPMPDTIRDEMAFIDRLHFYLPGWEIPQMRIELRPITPP